MTVLEALISLKKLTDGDAEKIKLESVKQGIPPEAILISRHLVSSNDLTVARSVSYNIPFIDLSKIQINREVLNVLDEKNARSHQCVIFELIDDGSVKMAMVDPMDIQSIRYLEKLISKRIIPYFAYKEQILNILETKYGAQIESKVVGDIEQAHKEGIFQLEEDKDARLELIASNSSMAPIVKIINTVLDFALKAKASDVHIEPLKDRLRFRFRVNGILVEKLSIPITFHAPIVSRIKIMSRLKIDEKRIPQDGRFDLKTTDSGDVDVRVSTLPANYGEKIVLRLLKKTGGIPKLDDAGLRGSAYKVYMESLKATSGIVLVTGPTGSGKTQTLASSLSILNKEAVNIVSIEDPVEIVIDGVNQVQVNNEAGLTFASALRSFLRQDPNIIMVGEIRDEETARLATQAALTGHLVLSTIHTNSAAGALPRLMDMGIETYLISSTVDVVVAQRLVRVLCEDCKAHFSASDEVKVDILKMIGALSSFDVNSIAKNTAEKLKEKFPEENIDTDKIYMYKPVGCAKCNNTGYTGRIGVFEVLKITPEISQMIIKRLSDKDIENRAKENGMISMLQDGLLRVLEGTTTLEEVIRVLKD